MKPAAAILAVAALLLCLSPAVSANGALSANVEIQKAISGGHFDNFGGLNNIPLSVNLGSLASGITSPVDFSKQLELSIINATGDDALAKRIVELLDVVATVTLKVKGGCSGGKKIDVDFDVGFDLSQFADGKITVGGKTVYVDPEAIAATLDITVSSLTAISKGVSVGDGSCCSTCNLQLNMTADLNLDFTVLDQSPVDKCLSYAGDVAALCKSHKAGRYCHPCPYRADWWVQCSGSGAAKEYMCTTGKYFEARQGQCIDLPKSCNNGNEVCKVPACPAAAPPPPTTPTTIPTTCGKLSIVSVSVDYPWVKQTIGKVMKDFIAKYPGSTYTLSKDRVYEGKTYTTLTVSIVAANPSAATAWLVSQLQGIKDVTSVTASPCGASPTVAPTSICSTLTIKSIAADYPWVKMSIEKALQSFLSKYPGTTYTLTKGSVVAGTTTSTLTITIKAANTPAALAWLISQLKGVKDVTSVTSAPCGATPTVAPTTCVKFSVVSVAVDYPWVKMSIEKVLKQFQDKFGAGTTYKLTKDKVLDGKTYNTLIVSIRAANPSAATAWLLAALKGVKDVVSATAGSCATPPVAPTAPPRTSTCVKFTVKSIAVDYPWVKMSIEKALTAFAVSYPGTTYTVTKVGEVAGTTTTSITVTIKAADTAGATASLAAQLKAIKDVTSVTSGPCTVAPAVAPTTCFKYTITSVAVDYPWVKQSIDKALKDFIALYPGTTYTLTKGPATTSTTTYTTTSPITTTLIVAVKAGNPNTAAGSLTVALAAIKDVTSVTQGPCVSATVPTCQKYGIVAKAGDWKWVQQDVGKLLNSFFPKASDASASLEGPQGSSGGEEYGTLKVTFTAADPTSVVSALTSALQPTAYIKSFTNQGAC